MTSPVWNPRGDRLIFGTIGGLFPGSPDQATPPERVYHQPGGGSFDPNSCDEEDRVTRDGRVVYLRGAPERPVLYLRVIPDWASKMKRAVDEANR